jgi:hypothetical protein
MCVLLAVVKCVNYLCLCAYYVNLLSALDSNDVGFSEEREVFEYQEEDQGQADQGKPSILDAYLNPIHLLCMYHKGFSNCMFLHCYRPRSNYLLAQAPQANLVSSFEMTPLNTYSLPLQ